VAVFPREHGRRRHRERGSDGGAVCGPQRRPRRSGGGRPVGAAVFRSCQGGDGGFGYTGPGSASPPRAAIGALVLALARQKDTAEFQAAFRCLQQLEFESGPYFFYYLYYASQAFFHADPEAWKRWSAESVRRLAALQGPDGGWGENEGPAFATSAALLSLALHYRFLPIYER
jgi:hypothetical protein